MGMKGISLMITAVKSTHEMTPFKHSVVGLYTIQFIFLLPWGNNQMKGGLTGFSAVWYNPHDNIHESIDI